VEHVNTQRTESQIERHLKIRRKVRLRDLQPLGLEIVDEHLAQAAFPSQALLAGQHRTRYLLGFGYGGSDRPPPAVGRGLGRMGTVFVARGGAFGEGFVDPELAAIADCDDAPGDGAVLIRINSFVPRGPGEVGVTFLELLRFGRKLVGPIVLGDVVEFRQALLKARDLLGRFRCELRRFRMNPAIFGGEAVIGVEHRLGPGPARAQFRGLSFQLLDREPADQGGIIPKAFLAGAEQVAPDGAAGRLVGGQADNGAERGSAGTAPWVSRRRNVCARR
jgi:hypothetical protein